MIKIELTNISEIEMLPVKIDYVAETSRDNWECDQWRVTISSVNGNSHLDYFTGLGRRSRNKPIRPKVADVLYSLILDASAAEENFHDWCDNYGYSNDSIKAMNIYKKCLETAQILRKHFSPDTLRQINELLQDY